jgi:hypothetical protein
VIDLRGPEGNAFYLLGYVDLVGKRQQWSPSRIERVKREMMSGDYQNLVEVFAREMGDLVVIRNRSGFIR